MKLRWERAGVVTMTARVEEVAQLAAAARLASRALAGGDPDGPEARPAAGLARILADFDRASGGLARSAPPAEAGMFNAGSRALQRRFGTEPLADRIAERFGTDRVSPGDRAFIERADMVFLATADAQGRPDCSYKGGDPGFVRVVDDATLAFPSYDGNGMYLSWGNALENPEIGLLFIDFERGHRLRCNGSVTIDGEDPLLAEYPEAQFIVRVHVREVFPNCPRYIHRYRLVERSTCVPHRGRPTPVPDWKKDDWAADVLPAVGSQSPEGGAPTCAP